MNQLHGRQEAVDLMGRPSLARTEPAWPADVLSLLCLVQERNQSSLSLCRRPLLLLLYVSWANYMGPGHGERAVSEF